MSEAERALTPLEAAAAIREFERWDSELRRRTTGLVWMFWGVVAPAIFLSYAFVARVVDEYPPWMALVWMPWAALGILFTALLWRSVGIAMRETLTSRQLILHVLLFWGGTIGLVILSFVFKLPTYPPAVVLAGLGALTSAFGVGALRGSRRGEGVVKLAAGLLMFAYAIVESVFAAGRPFMDGVGAVAFVNVFVSAIGLGAVGLYLTVRR